MSEVEKGNGDGVVELMADPVCRLLASQLLRNTLELNGNWNEKLFDVFLVAFRVVIRKSSKCFDERNPTT